MENKSGEATTPSGKSWMPLTAGILSILAGVGEGIGGLVIATVSTLARTFGRFPGLAALGAGIVGVCFIIVGIIAIIGGIFAIRRSLWGLALAGAICGLFLPHVTVLGILAIVFVVLSKDQFL